MFQNYLLCKTQMNKKHMINFKNHKIFFWNAVINTHTRTYVCKHIHLCTHICKYFLEHHFCHKAAQNVRLLIRDLQSTKHISWPTLWHLPAFHFLRHELIAPASSLLSPEALTSLLASITPNTNCTRKRWNEGRQAGRNIQAQEGRSTQSLSLLFSLAEYIMLKKNTVSGVNRKVNHLPCSYLTLPSMPSKVCV